ncbi:MAG: DUF5947 family protein [Candidatus Binatia bacterium]
MPEENNRPFAKLKRFVEPQAKPQPRERCEFCGVDIGEQHSHAVNTETRSLLCVCRPCYLLFTREGAARGRFKAVPERYLHAPGLILTDAQWNGLQIPVGIAFFFFNTSLGRMVVFYPGPAGATESLLSLETWEELAGANPLLATLAADVEALLVRNVQRRGGFECYIVPIDSCYELVGRIRRRWKGFDGGEEAWQEIDAFFADVRSRSVEANPEAVSAE